MGAAPVTDAGRVGPAMAGTAPPPSVTVGELVVGGAVVAVAVVAEVSLALAHGRWWSLGATAGLAALALVVVAVVAWRAPGRPRIRTEPGQLGILALVGVVAVFLFTPGFPVAMAGWDPGIYVNHGFSIARTGAYDIADPVADHEPPLPNGAQPPNDRFPGLNESEIDDGRSVVAFYHLYPALLAPAADVAGERGVTNVNPALGVLAVLTLTLVGGRAYGPLTGALAGLLGAVGMIEVWHARYPTSELLTQLLVVGAILGVLVAARTGWRPPAAAAGFLTGLVFLARADGLVVLLVVGVGLAAIAAAGRFDRRCAWFTAGVAATLPHGLLQAYRFAGRYTDGQDVPEPAAVVAVIALLVVAGALVARTGWAERVTTAAAQHEQQRLLGGAVVAGFVALLVWGYARAALAADELPAGLTPGGPGSGTFYASRSLVRLTWFLTPVGVAAAAAGVAVLALRPWRFTRWVAVVPGLALLPLYLLNPRIAPRLMWWTRRFVPVILVALVVLVAVALAAGLRHQGRWRLPVRLVSGAAAVYLVVAWLAMSLPLRDHRELDGSFAIHREVAALARGEPAVYLWSLAPGPATGSANAFGSTVALRAGAVSAQLPPTAGPDALAAYAEAFPGRPLFLVADGDDLPPPLAPLLDGADLRPVLRVDRDLPLWELTYDDRPDEATTMRFAFTVWRYTS